MIRASKFSTGPQQARSSDFPLATPSRSGMSSRTTSPNSFIAMARAHSPPMLPAPMTLIFARRIAMRPIPSAGVCWMNEGGMVGAGPHELEGAGRYAQMMARSPLYPGGRLAHAKGPLNQGLRGLPGPAGIRGELRHFRWLLALPNRGQFPCVPIDQDRGPVEPHRTLILGQPVQFPQRL